MNAKHLTLVAGREGNTARHHARYAPPTVPEHRSTSSDRRGSYSAVAVPTDKESPRALAITDEARIYEGLPQPVAVVQDAMEAIATLQHSAQAGTPIAVIFVDVNLRSRGGYATLRQLREHGVRVPVHLVAEHPLPSDAIHAVRNGATSMLCRTSGRLLAVLNSVHPAASLPGSQQLPSWMREAVLCLREYLASEAQPLLLELYTAMHHRNGGVAVSCAELMGEASLLLQDREDREGFLALAKRRCALSSKKQ